MLEYMLFNSKRPVENKITLALTQTEATTYTIPTLVERYYTAYSIDGGGFTPTLDGAITVPSGEHVVRLRSRLKESGVPGHIWFNTLGSSLIEVADWGADNEVAYCFKDCTQLKKVPTFLPPRVTNLNYMFEGCLMFDQDISMWDTSNIHTLNGTFKRAIRFNKPIGTWNTSKVTDLTETFSNVIAFNQSIDAWDVSNVIYMNRTFDSATNYNHPLSSWNTRKVTKMNSTFAYTSNFYGGVVPWDTRNVTDMGSMFAGTLWFSNDLTGWNVGKVTNWANFGTGATRFREDQFPKFK